MRVKLLYGLEQPEEERKKPLRYVLYARKSSEDAEAQAKSLPDQIADCRKYAKDNHLNIVEVIQESKSAKKSGKRVFLPFRHLIFCKECGSPMVVRRSKGRNGLYYVNARCDNKECPREHKSCRLKHILEQIYEDLDKLEFTKEEYIKLSKNMTNYVDIKMNDLIIERRSLSGAKTQKGRKIDSLASDYSSLDKSTPEIVRKKLREQIETLQNEIIAIDAKIDKINEQIVDPDSLKLTQENFLKLINSANFKTRAGDMVEKDILARKLYLKLEIDNKNKLPIRYREPFNLLAQNHLNGSGAPD